MSAAVKLSSKMPGDPATNGIDDYQEDLVREPDEVPVAHPVYWWLTGGPDGGKDLDDEVRRRRAAQ